MDNKFVIIYFICCRFLFSYYLPREFLVDPFLIFNAKFGNRVALGVSSTITDGVRIPDNKFVPPGRIINTQAQADALPARVESPYETINNGVLHVNKELAKGYNAQTIHRLATELEGLLEHEEILQTQDPTGSHNATASK